MYFAALNVKSVDRSAFPALMGELSRHLINATVQVKRKKRKKSDLEEKSPAKEIFCLRAHNSANQIENLTYKILS